MRTSLLVSIVGVLLAALVFADAFAQNTAQQTWPDAVAVRPRVAEKDKRPAPRRSLAGTWGFIEGKRQLVNQASGVQLKPNNGRPENQLPYTPHGLELYRSHKGLGGADAVPPAQTNDPRVRCEPLGFPRHNHYDLGV